MLSEPQIPHSTDDMGKRKLCCVLIHKRILVICRQLFSLSPIALLCFVLRVDRTFSFAMSEATTKTDTFIPWYSTKQVIIKEVGTNILHIYTTWMSYLKLSRVSESCDFGGTWKQQSLYELLIYNCEMKTDFKTICTYFHGFIFSHMKLQKRSNSKMFFQLNIKNQLYLNYRY